MILAKQVRLLLCVVPILMFGCGQDENTAAPDPRVAEMRTAAKLEKLSAGLNLTAEQKATVKTLLDEETQTVGKINAEAGRTGGDRVLQIIAVRTNTYEKIRPLLTPEQSEKLADVINKLEGRKKRR